MQITFSHHDKEFLLKHRNTFKEDGTVADCMSALYTLLQGDAFRRHSDEGDYCRITVTLPNGESHTFCEVEHKEDGLRVVHCLGADIVKEKFIPEDVQERVKEEIIEVIPEIVE